jgi:hypothetical protein
MTHNEERAHWIKEGAIGLGGKFIQYLSVELEVKYSCQSRLDKECYCYPNLVEIRIPKKLDEEPTENFFGILISKRLLLSLPHITRPLYAQKMFHEMVQSLPFYLTSYHRNLTFYQ